MLKKFLVIFVGLICLIYKSQRQNAPAAKSYNNSDTIVYHAYQHHPSLRVVLISLMFTLLNT